MNQSFIDALMHFFSLLLHHYFILNSTTNYYSKKQFTSERSQKCFNKKNYPEFLYEKNSIGPTLFFSRKTHFFLLPEDKTKKNHST